MAYRLIMKPNVPVVMGKSRLVRPIKGGNSAPSSASGVSGRVYAPGINPKMKVLDYGLIGQARKATKVMRGNGQMITLVPYSQNRGLQI